MSAAEVPHASMSVRQRPPHGVRELGVTVDLGDAQSSGDLTVPARALGLVLFAHDGGSSRESPRDRFVAAALQRAGIGTLLFDLLSRDEEIDAIDLLARRLGAVTDWTRRQPELRGLPLGYFGAGAGAAVALVASVERPDVCAVVSGGGRLELLAHSADRVLESVRAPTLLIVGGADEAALSSHRAALACLAGPNRLEVLAGATHGFEQPGALAQVAELAIDWFTTQLGLRALLGGAQEPKKP